MKPGKIISIVLLTLFVGKIVAEPLSVSYKPYYDTSFGVNYHQNWIAPKPGWDQLLVKTQPGFNFYFGWRFHHNFSADLGYEWSANKTLTTVINSNATFLGVQNTGGAVALTGKVRFKTGHLDINYFYPVLVGKFSGFAPEGILSVGLGTTKAHVRIIADPDGGFASNFTSLQGRDKILYRLGVGIQTLLVDDIGARMIARVENTSMLRARGSVVAENDGTKRLFKDGFSLAVGLFVKF